MNQSYAEYVLKSAPRALHFEYHEITQSTNLLAKQYAKEHTGDAVFVAKSQTGGRGRLGRSFKSTPGGLYMSILCHPSGALSDAVKITALTAVAVCRAISDTTDVTPSIKWVNDIKYRGKKIAGILAEGMASESGLEYAVIGIGVNLERVNFGDELSGIAASIGDFTSPPAPHELCAKIISHFYGIIEKSDIKEELEYYKSHSELIGKRVSVYRGNETFSADVLGVDNDFGLLLRKGQDTLTLSSGEVSIREPGAAPPKQK